MKHIAAGRGVARRGQVLVLLAAFMFVLIALLGVLTDIVLMTQEHFDLQGIAADAAHAGAQDINLPYFTANCTAALRESEGNCNSVLLLTTNAASDAQSYAEYWYQQDETWLNQRYADPAGNPVSVSMSDDQRSITVTATRCFVPSFLYFLTQNSGPCQGVGVAVTGTFTAIPDGGL